MKKISAMMLAILMIISSCLTVYAAVPETVVPLWDNINSINCTLTFDGTDGLGKGTARGLSGTTRMSGTVTVYVQTSSGWEEVGSASNTVSGRSLSVSVDFEGETGEYYKAVFEVTCVRNGVSESDSWTAYKTC